MKVRITQRFDDGVPEIIRLDDNCIIDFYNNGKISATLLHEHVSGETDIIYPVAKCEITGRANEIEGFITNNYCNKESNGKGFVEYYLFELLNNEICYNIINQ